MREFRITCTEEAGPEMATLNWYFTAANENAALEQAVKCSGFEEWTPPILPMPIDVFVAMEIE